MTLFTDNPFEKMMIQRPCEMLNCVSLSLETVYFHFSGKIGKLS